MITYPNVKVNVGLNVLRRREDGYHDLETMFFPYFEISDILEITAGDDYSRISAALFSKYKAVQGSEGADSIVQAVSDDGKLMITIAKENGVAWDPLKDLTAKAYCLLAGDFDLPAVKIWLEKRSPVGAGLGGGSSDAAFALCMLNSIFSIGLDEEALALYAARLGSDCPFFIYNRPMIGEGRGEILTDCHLPVSREEIRQGFILPGCRIKVVAPQGVQVSTAGAYRGIRPHEPEIPLREALSRPLEEWRNVLSNDFEETVFASHPELAKIKQSLYDSGAVYAAMSGSGSALFGIYRECL